jgi:hypothetical protein
VDDGLQAGNTSVDGGALPPDGKWALPEDNTSMLEYSTHVKHIQEAITLQTVFLYTQFLSVAHKLIVVMRTMVRAHVLIGSCVTDTQYLVSASR